MESWCLSKHKYSCLFWLLMFMMIPTLIVRRIQGVCIEEERKALLEIKASLNESFYVYNVKKRLPTWVDPGSTGGSSDGECCDWERVKCDTITGHVKDLSLSNLVGKSEFFRNKYERVWPLNVSPFVHFKELRSLDLSWNNIDNTIVSSGLEKFSSLKKLEKLNLSNNFIENGIFPSLGALTSLKILDLSRNRLEGYFPAHEFGALENLEVLDLSLNRYYGTFQMQGFERVSILRKLKILSLGYNRFNESLIASLSSLPSLETLNLGGNKLSGLFPAEGLAHLTKLRKLDLSENYDLMGSPSIQGCKSLLRLERLESINLAYNNFNKSIMSCLSFLPSLKILDLSSFSQLESSFPVQELHNFPELEVLLLGGNNFNGTLPMEALPYFHHLKVLDLSRNNFVGSIPSTIGSLSSLKAVSFANNALNGSLPDDERHNFPELEVLLLGGNNFNGTLPMEALAYFHHLKVLDFSRNHFVGSIPSTIGSLSSLKAVSFANNALNGSLPDDGFCELRNLHELDLSGNIFDGNVPECFNRLSSLKLFDISSNRFTLFPSLIANLTSLEYIDIGLNKFEGSISFSLFSNHTKLEVFQFESNNAKFVVETEEPLGWIPMFQLKFLVLSNCNIKSPKGSVVPGFLHNQHKLRVLDLSHNYLQGQFPSWLIENNTMLELLNLRNNLFGGIICMPVYTNVNTKVLDMSRNHMIGTIPGNIQNILPGLSDLDLSRNALNGTIPSSIVDLGRLDILDLSDNDFSGELPKGLFTNLSILKVSKNRLHGQVLSGNLSLGRIAMLYLDSNCFTGKIGNMTDDGIFLSLLDISNNFFTGMIPGWISNTRQLHELVMRNNRLEGQFPCGTTSFEFLDISENSFSGPIPSCLNLKFLMHLHLGSNSFTGSIPNVFGNLTNVLTLDIGNNNLSGRIPEFLGELSKLRILLLGKNNFIGSIPKHLCELNNVSLIDLSSNSLSGSIPPCLQNITGPSELAFLETRTLGRGIIPAYQYGSILSSIYYDRYDYEVNNTRDEVQFTTKSISRPYKGNILDYMAGLDLSCNKLTGQIPQELGLMTQIRALNLSHNQLTGPIPVNLSNLANIESLDLSSNSLSGEVPSLLIEINSLAVFNVSYNNLSGRLPEMKAQFSTFPKESYEGNPLLCGPPLEKRCAAEIQVTDPSTKEENEKWYDIDMTSFYGSSSSTWFVFMLGFAGILYANPYWRRRWLDLVEECMYTCYYFFYDLASKLSKIFHK